MKSNINEIEIFSWENSDSFKALNTLEIRFHRPESKTLTAIENHLYELKKGYGI